MKATKDKTESNKNVNQEVIKTTDDKYNNYYIWKLAGLNHVCNVPELVKKIILCLDKTDETFKNTLLHFLLFKQLKHTAMFETVLTTINRTDKNDIDILERELRILYDNFLELERATKDHNLKGGDSVPIPPHIYQQINKR